LNKYSEAIQNVQLFNDESSDDQDNNNNDDRISTNNGK